VNKSQKRKGEEKAKKSTKNPKMDVNEDTPLKVAQSMERRRKTFNLTGSLSKQMKEIENAAKIQ